MSQEENIPLLRGAFHNINYNNNIRNNRRSFSYLKLGFIISLTLLLSINLGYFIIESNEEILLEEVAKIPYEYYLGLKSEAEYVIETSPPVNPDFSNLLINEDPNSNFTQESSHDRVKIAEIVARNYKAWTPAYYEVREERYDLFNNYKALTTRSYMSGLWFIGQPPKVHISFVSSSEDINGIKYDNKIKDDNNGVKKPRYDDQEGILKCDYEINWNYKYFGEIYRKCPKQDGFVKIAYVKGSSEWGMQWLDPERVETYGIVTRPTYVENRQMRNVMIRPDSPFPPILPALYLAYFDQVINRGGYDGQ